MDDRKKPKNGTFTQVPNIFFDTCDLPETAQILYLRLLRKIGYKGGRFVGSIRDLSAFVRMSKGTADRMSKRLKEAGLINLEREEGGAMTITVNTDKLWDLNRQHYDNPVPIWDSKLPDLSQAETTSSQLETNPSQDESESSQAETDLSSEESSNTNKTFDKTEEILIDPSSDQKANGTGYLRMYMRKFLLELGEGDMMDQDLAYMQELYQISELDQASFRAKAESAMDRMRTLGRKDIDCFYDCLDELLGMHTRER